MSLDTDENFIRSSLPSLLLSRELKAKTGGTVAEWRLNEVHHTHSTPRNIEFSLTLVRGLECLRVSGKIHRETSKLSKIEVEEI
jgi:hypothetical protein